jgi:hypothetical protein
MHTTACSSRKWNASGPGRRQPHLQGLGETPVPILGRNLLWYYAAGEKWMKEYLDSREPVGTG